MFKKEKVIVKNKNRFRFRKAEKIKRNKEILELLRYGKRWKGSVVSVFYRTAPFHRSRCAIAVPRKSGSSVVRNRIKRIIREHVRYTLLRKNPRYDIVIKVIPQTDGRYDDGEIKEALSTWFKKLEA